MGKKKAEQSNPTDRPGDGEFEEGPLPPPEQKEAPTSTLVIQFAAPGVADITSMRTGGEVALSQLAYAGMFLLVQAFTNWQMPAMHEMVKATVTQVLTEMMKPKIEQARADFRIPPDLLRSRN